jgi:hypothetical protein
MEARAGGGPGADWADVLEDGFVEELDEAFHRCKPSVHEAMERRLARHVTEYVELT